MKIEIWAIGKTGSVELAACINQFLNRLKHYHPTTLIEYSIKYKSNNPDSRKQEEANLVMSKLRTGDYLILLDEKGHQITSIGFATFLQQQMNTGKNRLIFLIGGAFGFSESLYNKAAYKLSLSRMTFTHDMVRLIFVEQVYRAFTILKNEKYHNS